MYTDVTEKCKEVLNRGNRTFVASFIVDDTKYSDVKSFKISIPSASNGKISIGETISKSVEIITEKVDIREGKKIELFEGVKLDSGKYEDIPMGIYKISSAVTKDCLTTIVADGPLYTETQLGYFSSLIYPATTIQMLNEISESIKVPIDTNDLEEIYVDSKPEGYTYREVIGYIAAMHGTNAVETRDGNIAFKWYEHCDSDIFTDKTGEPELANSLFTVNRFECYIDNDISITRGDGVSGITISNPLMTEAAADVVWRKIFGFSYHPGTFPIKSGTPCVDPWDSFIFNDEEIIATELEYTHDGGLQNTFKSVGESETDFGFKGPTTLALERYYAELVLINKAMVNKLTVDEADIRYATIDEMNVTKAEIETLSAISITTNNFEAEVAKLGYVTITEFNALSGRVATLDAEMLTADSAILKEMQSNIAEIDTLIFGSAGGTSIQTEFSNAVIAQVGEAQIKSAMIEEVLADKITGLDLNTTRFTVHSEDGKSTWVDNTIQISDGSKVRVQIGKDASDDYNMYVWDKSGNLMFDALGLTEDGITRQIIRDDVVKDDANISASKLNIDSLFKVINEDGSHTLKSSKIYVDDEAQTLDVAFKSMTTSLTNLENIQVSQGTQLSVIQGQISSKIWQEDIDTAVNEVEGDITTLSTQYTSLNQTVTGLSSTVGSHTTTINGLTTRVASAESTITQQADLISAKVSKDGVIAAINLSSENALILANKIDLVGAVTFSSLDSDTQSKINTASNRATYHYGTCSTAAATVAKVVTLSGFSLYTGAMVSVYFTYANTASSPTLNVNSTGAKSIRVNNAVITAPYYWQAGNTVTFIYNGTYWVMADTSANNILANWCYNNDKAYIDGGKIYAKSVTAAQIDVENLFAQDITATGSITGLTIISNGSTASERVKIGSGTFTVGSDNSAHVNIANAGLNILNGSTGLGGVRNNTGGGIEIFNASGKPFAIRDGDNYPITINESSSYAGIIHVNYPILCADIDAVNIRCTDITTYSGVSLTELNSNKSPKVHIANIIATTGATGNISLGKTTSEIIVLDAYSNGHKVDVFVNNFIWFTKIRNYETDATVNGWSVSLTYEYLNRSDMNVD